MEGIQVIHLTDECLQRVRQLQLRYADLMQLKGKQRNKVVALALLSFVSKNNPIEYKRTIDDIQGHPILVLDRVLPYVHVPRD